MRGRDERAVVVEAEVASPFEVVEPELALELAIVELDRPAQAGEALRARVCGKVREPEVARRFLALGPLDDEPLLAGRLVVVPDRVRRADAQEGETARDLLAGLMRLLGDWNWWLERLGRILLVRQPEPAAESRSS